MYQQGLIRAATKNSAKSANRLATAHARLLEAEKLRRTGNLKRAQVLCEALLEEHPDYVGALQTLGVVQLEKKGYRQAFSCFIQAAMYCPKDWTNLTNLATVYQKLGARDLAAQTLEQARRLHPDDAATYYTLGEIYREDREYDLAAQAYEKALRLESAHAGAAHGLGDCCLQLGRAVDAAAAFKRAHDLKPDWVKVVYGLGQVPASVIHVDMLAALERVRRQGGETEDDFRSDLAFARAAALDRAGRHREAWDNLVQGNRLEFPKHEPDHRRQMERCDVVRKEALAQPAIRSQSKSGRSSECPLSLFIVGVSRSGKTTLERLAGALDGVKRGHESRLVSRAVLRTSQNSGLLNLGTLADLPKALDGKFAEFYLDELEESVQGAKIFTSTHPGMIPSIGRIAAAIPDSRFIFVKRDANDIALRIFMTKYMHTNHYAYEIKTIIAYISWYHQMIDIWLDKLPGRAICVGYEDMVVDPAATLSQVAELCGVPMAEAPPPKLGDDRGCADPYREFIRDALAQ